MRSQKKKLSSLLENCEDGTELPQRLFFKAHSSWGFSALFENSGTSLSLERFFRTLSLQLSLDRPAHTSRGWAGPRCARLHMRMRAAVGETGTLFRLRVRPAECVERSTVRRRLAELGGEAGAAVAAAAGGRGWG